MRRGHGTEHQIHPVEQLSAPLQLLISVEKAGRVAVQCDRLDLLTLLLNARLQRRQEILLLNLVKRRSLVRQCADAKEGILTGVHGSLLVGIAKSYPDRLPRRRQLRRRAADKR